jgi:hypothetical protein
VMHRIHEFNTRWWGAPVGHSDDIDLLMANEAELTRELQQYDWCEVRVRHDDVASSPTVKQNTFVWFDTQLHYRLSLRRLDRLPQTAKIIACSELAINVESFASFQSERYRLLPNVSQTKVDDRYKLWAKNLIESNPEYCATAFYKEKAVGFFFGQPDGEFVRFSLAVADQMSLVPGMFLYSCAADYFKSLGARTLTASISSQNVGALNIHAALGCQFYEAVGCWLRHPNR